MHARREKVDPWFLKPYEPAAESSLPQKEANHAAPAAKPQKKAALLGGLKR
jgi:hypothetical protein